jgi:RimJ/RimL family protein N-acetyltransferase
MERENILRGEKVQLTALRQEDADVIAEWYQDTAFLRNYDSSPAYPKTEKQLATMLEEEQKDNNTFLFAVRLLDSGRIIGLLQLDGIAWTHGTSWVSIGIGEEADRGQGYGREAMEIGLRFAFDELNLHRVCLTVFSYNQAARTLYERLGFRHEGTYREHLMRDGRRHDMLLYGLLRREWQERTAGTGA